MTHVHLSYEGRVRDVSDGMTGLMVEGVAREGVLFRLSGLRGHAIHVEKREQAH